MKSTDTADEAAPDSSIPGKRSSKGKRGKRKPTPPTASDGHVRVKTVGASRVFAPRIHPDAMGRRIPTGGK